MQKKQKQKYAINVASKQWNDKGAGV